MCAATVRRAGRLDRALAEAVPELSRSRIAALIQAGRVSLGGSAVTDPARRVDPGQTFDIVVPQPAVADILAQPIPLRVIHEDGDVIVVDKPAGLVVHPAAGNPDGTLVNALLAHCGSSLSGIGGAARPGIVHRLDKDTSGLMVIAKHDRAHAALARQFADRTLSRRYGAVVHGRPPQDAGTVDAPIGRHPRDRKRMAVRRDVGRAAVTHYRLERRLGTAASLVECRLDTGRTHQIRVHLAAIGAPVIGDPLYGRAPGSCPDCARRFPRQALHARSLHFLHPRDGREVRFESELPFEITELITCLKSLQKTIPDRETRLL